MKENLKENKGITLVALIITIIILLILAVVTISSVNEGKLFAHANNAATMYQERQKEENQILYELLGKIPNKTNDQEKTEDNDPLIGKTITEYYISENNVVSDVLVTDFNGKTCTYKGVKGIEYEMNYEEGKLTIKDQTNPTAIEVAYMTENGNIIAILENKLLTTDGATDITGLEGYTFNTNFAFSFDIDSSTGIGILNRNTGTDNNKYVYALLNTGEDSSTLLALEFGILEVGKKDGVYTTISDGEELDANLVAP